MASPKGDLKKGGLSKDHVAKALSMVAYLEKRPEALEFLKPVDYKSCGLDDYPLIIKNPMDLSTIKKKVKGGKYSNLTEVVSDVSLIWENCRVYNQIGSGIVNHADKMQVYMKKFCAKHKLATETTETAETQQLEVGADTVSFENKVDLAKRLRKVNFEVLAEVVKVVESQCSDAVEDLDPERIQLKVDCLDRSTFDTLNKYLNAVQGEDTRKRR